MLVQFFDVLTDRRALLDLAFNNLRLKVLGELSFFLCSVNDVQGREELLWALDSDVLHDFLLQDSARLLARF